MDTIFIKGITSEATIGVWEWERHVRQKLVVDVEFGTDFAKAAASDELADALDYQKITATVVTVCEDSSYRLLESLIAKIADTLWDTFELRWLRVTLDKGGVLKNAKSVGLVTERGNSD